MAATVRLATRLDVPLINKMVHELAQVEGTASSCTSTETKLNEILFKDAPFHGPTIFLLEVDEPPSKEETKEEAKEEAMSGTVVTKPSPPVKPIDEDSTASVELMLFRSISNVKYKGRFVGGSPKHSDFLSEVSSPKSSPLQTSDMEEPVLEVFRSRSEVNLKDHEETIGEVAALRSVSDPESQPFKVASRIVVGFVHVFPNFSTYLSKAGLYMEAFYIRKPYRSMGLGTMFLKKIAREAVKLGMERMEWSVLYSNDPAIKFYEGMGAVIKPGFRKCAIDGEALVNCEP